MDMRLLFQMKRSNKLFDGLAASPDRKRIIAFTITHSFFFLISFKKSRLSSKGN